MHRIVRTLKNRWREIGLVVCFPVCICAFLAARQLDIEGPTSFASVDLHEHINRFNFLMFLGMDAMMGAVLFSVMLGEGMCKPKTPRIHVWTHNGLTVVAAADDVELAIQERERLHLSFDPGWAKLRRIEPRLYALFSDNFTHWSQNGVLVYPMEIYRELEGRCVVVRTEMQTPEIRNERIDKGAVTVQRLWQLITGDQNSELPSELDELS